MTSRTAASGAPVVPSVVPPRKRFLWLDAVKGIGIIAVVYGHVAAADPGSRYVYLWHMPLFFFLAGYVFKPDADWRRFLRDKALRLLLPYAVFLMLLSIPDLLATAATGAPRDWALFAATHIAGGKSVYGWLAPFWFITCLFLSQGLVNAGTTLLAPRTMVWLACVCVALAYANALWLPRFWLPWAANVCLLAAPLLYMGYRFRQHEAGIPRWLMRLALPAAVLGLVLAGMQWLAVPDMKNTRYGTPLASLFFAVCITISLMSLARRWLDEGLAARVLARIGEASLLIMFLHMAVQITMLEQLHIQSQWLRIAAAIVLPTLAYRLLQKHALSRAVLLGR